MQVLFISDFTLEQRQGGAQVSNALVIEEGRKRGYEITEHSHNSSVTDFLRSYDLIVNSNLECISKTSPERLNFALKADNSVRLEHDSCSYLGSQDRESLFKNSNKNFFLSQYHYSFFQELYGDYFKNVEIVYDPINTDVFKKVDGLEKVYDVVYCGYLHPLKGLNNLLNFARSNPERKVDVFGWSDVNPANLFNNVPNVNFRGEHNHEKMASIFQRCDAVFHSPVVREPFCRMIGEALLCGVDEIIGDTSKIGAYLEFQEVGYEAFKEGCKNAASNFWERVSV